MLARAMLNFLQLEWKIQISFSCKLRLKTETQKELHEQFKSELRTAKLLNEMIQRNVQLDTSVMSSWKKLQLKHDLLESFNIRVVELFTKYAKWTTEWHRESCFLILISSYWLAKFKFK